MKVTRLATLLLVAMGGRTAAFGGGADRPPVKVFLDTDVCVDAGDLAALAMMHGLAHAGEIEILGVTCVTSNPDAPGCVDAVNRWYGRPDIPVGALKEPGFLEKSDFSESIAKMWPNRYQRGTAAAPEATALFRQVVAGQPDGSVVLVSIGPLRNLRRFLESAADASSPLDGRDLIAKKVRTLSCMACVFKPVNPWGKGDLKVEWNIEQDVPSAKYVFARWPTTVMVSGFEIGWPLHADQGLVDSLPESPVAYGLKVQGGGRPAWDQTSLLYAARGLGEYWEAEGPGCCEIRDDGTSLWTARADGRHYHLKARMEARALARLIDSIQIDAERKRGGVEFKPGTAGTRTGWLGNTFRGGDRDKGRWVQLDMDDIFVFPDGRVVTDTVWDEAGRAIGFYMDGGAIGKVDDSTALTGGLAVTADDQYIFALRLERKLGESDPMWHGVARYTLDGKPAKWPGAEGRVRNVLFLHPPSEKGGRSLTGVAAGGGELFLADPMSRMVKIYGAADMAPRREFRLTPETDTPYKMTFDRAGRLWIIQKSAEGAWRIRAYTVRGEHADAQILDAGEPAAIALAPDGRLAVADNGPRQQVRFYSGDEQPVLKGTLGVEGGVYAGPDPGRVAADRFGGLTGVGLDQQGNIYVSSNGRGPGDDNGFGAKLQKFDPSGKCFWTLEGLEFVDSADVDPGEETSVFSKDARYELDWSKPTGEGWPHAGWTHQALTVHRFKYPNDPRLHIRQEGVRVVRARGGWKLQSCQWDGHLCVYRFDGEIAVPVAVFSRGGSKPGEWPPSNQHKDKAWMWADKNGDGDFQADEFEAIAPGDIDVMRAYFLDEEGTAWIGEQNGKIHRFPLEPGDGHAGPLYALKTPTTVKAPDDIVNVRSLRYVAGQDTMFLATYSKANPIETWYPMAREIRRVDKWSTDRKPAWTTAIPYRFSDNRGRDIQPICMDVEGDYVFVGYDLGASDEHRYGEVVIFRACDGSRLGSVWAGPEVGGRIGAVDFSSAVHAHKLVDGTYVILVEDDEFAKIIYYLWKPPAMVMPGD